MGSSSKQEEDVWGDLEVQENIIEQLLDGSSHSTQPSLEEVPSSKRVRFTANSTLAVYPSEKSLSTEEGSDVEDDEDEYEDYDDDEEEDEDEDDGDSSDSEGTFSDDEIVINESQDYRDSLELPFIQHNTSDQNPPTTTTATPPNTTPPDSSEPRFDREALQVQVEPSTQDAQPPTTQDAQPPTTQDPQPSTQDAQPSTQEAQQRGWFQRRQGIQRYTPRYSPKSSPTGTAGDDGPFNLEAAGQLNLNSSATIPQPLSSATIPQEKPLIIQQVERAKQELHQEIARAKEASDNLTISSARLQESVSHLSDRIAISRQLLSALGCTLHFGRSILALRLVHFLTLPTTLPMPIQYHTLALLTTTLITHHLHRAHDVETDETVQRDVERDVKRGGVLTGVWVLCDGLSAAVACAVVVRWLVACSR